MEAVQSVIRISTALALAFAAFSPVQKTDLAPYTKTTTLLRPVQEGTTRIQSKQLQQRLGAWSIDVTYPELEGAGVFNYAVQKHLNSMLADVKKETPDDASAYGAYLKGTYTAEVLNIGVVSVLLDFEEYAPPAAHPWGILASITYDTKARRVIALSDMFRPGSRYLSRLSAIAIESLGEREYADMNAIHRGAGPVDSNFKVFTLTNTELVLHFQQYQVAAGAAGSEQVAIPLGRLAPLLQKQYRPQPSIR